MNQARLIETPAIPVPDYVPGAFARELAGETIELDKIPAVIKKRLRSAEKISVSEWAAKYRIVTDGPHVGPWRQELAPHTKKIMDTFGAAWVREVWMCAVEQSGKTATMLNCMGWCVDCDPGNIFYLMPTESTSNKIVGEKIKPLLQQSPALAKYLTGRDDDLGLSKIKLGHGVTIMPSHANSAASMATFAAKHCFGDEVDKYPPQAGKETDPITLIKKRNRTYRGRYKRFFASTPASRFIYQGVKNCRQVWEYVLRCPHCEQLIKPEGEHLEIDDELTAESLQPEQVSVACHECGALLDDLDRERAIRAGAWRCSKGAEVIRPTTVGFLHRAWDCLDISLHEIGVAWLKQKHGTQVERIAWANGYEAVDYEDIQQDRKEDQILRLVDEAMPREVVPRDICALALIADTQQIGFFYQVWAYGYGRDLETWRIDHGYVEDFGHLVDLAGRPWLDADGNEYRISAGLIDSGGGTNPHQPKHSRTAEVYEFCRRNPLFKPLKGRRDQVQPWGVTRLDYYPSRQGKKIPIPGGLTLYTINVTIYKGELARKLMIEPGGPGCFHLHAGTGEDYARQMCAEYQDDRGYWLCPKNKANHHWDVGVYGMALADIMGIRNRPRPGEQPQGRRVLSKGVK